MPDFNQSTPEFNEIFSRLARVCSARGLNADKIIAQLKDIFQLEDRMEFADMQMWLSNPLPALEPTVGKIGGGSYLFYAGCTHMLFGEDSCGKTLAMQAIVKQELEAHHHVVYLDFEEVDPRSMGQRLQEMNVDPDLAEYLHYMNIDRPMSRDNREMIETMIVNLDITLVVIDSVGTLLNIHGRDENKDGDVLDVMYRQYATPFAKAGAAVVLIDHTAKTSDGKTSSGSKRKRAHVSGAAYNVLVEDGDGWSRHDRGTAMIVCRKDRQGTHQRGAIVAFMEVEPAEMSATGELLVDFVKDRTDIFDETEAPVDRGGESRPHDPREKAIIEILTAETIPVSVAYIVEMLMTRGMPLKKSEAERMCKKLQGEGWIVLLKPADSPSGLSGWRISRVPSV